MFCKKAIHDGLCCFLLLKEKHVLATFVDEEFEVIDAELLALPSKVLVIVSGHYGVLVTVQH